MEDKRKSKRGRAISLVNAQHVRSTAFEQQRACNYILQLSSDDLSILVRYKELLIPQAASFGEALYKYLFDIPEAAEVLYAYEKNGGDVGDLIKTQVQHLLGLLGMPAGEVQPVGRDYVRLGLRPLWVIGAHHLYLDHILKRLATVPEIPPGDRQQLQSVLSKQVFLDLGLILHAYGDESLATLGEEVVQKESGYSRMIEMLCNIPQLLWSVDSTTEQLLYASPALAMFVYQELEGPVPVLGCFQPDDRERISGAWAQTLAGKQSSIEARVFREDEDEEY